MNILLEAIRELNKDYIYENFEKGKQHFEKHVCERPINAEKKFNEIKNSDYSKELFYIGLSEPEYIQEARNLSNENFADATKTTTISGVIGFKGKPEEDRDDCFYIIRNPSKFVSKNYLTKKYPGFGEILWEEYIKHAGTDKFVDVCITKGEDKFADTSNKSILTFYPAPLDKMERLKDACLNYYDEKGQMNQALKNQYLLVIPTYYIKQDDLGLRGYIVKPTSVNERKLDRGDRGVDNMLAYKKGEYIYKNKIIPFKTEDETSRLRDKEGNEYALSSRNPTLAKKTFEKAACKSIFNEEGRTNFRQKYIETAICKWFSNFDKLVNFLQNEPTFLNLLKEKFGISETEDYRMFRSKLNELTSSLSRQWEELENN